MIAMILAAGVGSRLSPLTLFMPKPMLPIANKPVMEYGIDLLAKNGITTIVANLNEMPDQIENYFGSGQRWGVNLTYSLERDLLGTAGAVKRVEDIFEETFVVLNGDVLTDLDLKAMLACHREKRAGVTIAVHAVEGSSRSGRVVLDGDGRIAQFEPMPGAEGAPLHFTQMGIYILEPEILELIPANTVYDLSTQLFPLLLEQGIPLYGYRSDDYWNELGSFGEYRAAQAAVLNGQIRDVLLPSLQLSPGIWQGRNNAIHASVQIVPPVLIGDHVQIEAGAEIGPNTVIGSNTIVEENATIVGSTILEWTYVGKLVNVQNSVVNRNCLINVPSNTSVFVSDHFLLGEVSEKVALRSFGQGLEWVVGLVIFLLSLPLWVVSALVALFAGRGPLLEKTFRATNHPQLEWESGALGWRAVPVYRFRADPATPAGRWLQRTGLRDLPGLLAVLKGDLALVGAGVMTPEQAEGLSEDWHRQRFLVPAGWTGLWYINSIRSPAGQLPFDELLIVDSFYAVTRTFPKDMQILFQSPGAWLKRLVLLR